MFSYVGPAPEVVIRLMITRYLSAIFGEDEILRQVW
jgi:hypothetical protein